MICLSDDFLTFPSVCNLTLTTTDTVHQQMLLKGRRATERKSVKRKKITRHDIILVHHLDCCTPYHVECYSNSEPYINRIFLLKNRSLRTVVPCTYLVINLTIVDMIVGGFLTFLYLQPYSTYATLCNFRT